MAAAGGVSPFSNSLWKASGLDGAQDVAPALIPEIVRKFRGVSTEDARALVERASKLTEATDLQRATQELSQAFFKIQQECHFWKEKREKQISNFVEATLQTTPDDDTAIAITEKEIERVALLAEQKENVEFLTQLPPCLPIIQQLGKILLKVAEERDRLLQPLVETAVEKLHKLRQSQQRHHDALPPDEARLKRMENFVSSHLVGYSFYPFISRWAKDFEKLLKEPYTEELEKLISKYEKGQRTNSEEFNSAPKEAQRLVGRAEAAMAVDKAAAEGKALIDTFLLPLGKLSQLHDSFQLLLTQISTTTSENWEQHRKRIEEHKAKYETLKPVLDAIVKLPPEPDSTKRKELQQLAALKQTEFLALLGQMDPAVKKQDYELRMAPYSQPIVAKMKEMKELAAQIASEALTLKQDKETLTIEEHATLITKFCGQDKPETVEGKIKKLVTLMDELQPFFGEMGQSIGYVSTPRLGIPDGGAKRTELMAEYAAWKKALDTKTLDIIADAIKAKGFKPAAVKAQYEYVLGAGTWGYSTRYRQWLTEGSTKAPKDNWWLEFA